MPGEFRGHGIGRLKEELILSFGVVIATLVEVIISNPELRPRPIIAGRKAPDQSAEE
jgi:hypothetical protein